MQVCARIRTCDILNHRSRSPHKFSGNPAFSWGLNKGSPPKGYYIPPPPLNRMESIIWLLYKRIKLQRTKRRSATACDPYIHILNTPLPKILSTFSKVQLQMGSGTWIYIKISGSTLIPRWDYCPCVHCCLEPVIHNTSKSLKIYFVQKNYWGMTDFFK